jgi:cellulose synthase/poly-beta-1,6-N-acetylglucosamine synthase-like glycosyltransferase
MQQLSDVIGALYRLIVLGLALYGIHNLVTTVLFIRTKSKSDQLQPIPSVKEWPRVTIQLPIFNEKYTLERLLQSVAQLDYPADRLQIQVLDDSTDDTAQLASRLVEKHRAAGVNIEWIHRNSRKGFKAGALYEGLRSATGELIGIFDADFLPNPDWLRKTVPYFQDEELGCLQTRWGHTNRNYNLLTKAEALAIDGHFIVEQTVRSGNDLFLNFNGTAGLWRRACIEDAGGWHWDTLTEDLDLSYRAQMRGWKIRYKPEVVVPAELPAEVEAFKKQQSRWAKGSFQVVRKILPNLLRRTDLPWYVRLIATLHLTGYLVHPLVLALLLFALPVGLLEPNAFTALPISGLAAFGPPLLYLTANSSLKVPWKERLKMLPLLVVVGFGISLSTSIGVLEGITGKKASEWVVTPKLNLSDSSKQNMSTARSNLKPVSRLVWAEIGLALYALVTILVLAPSLGWGMIPWMALYILGFFYIAGLNVIQHYPKLARRIKALKKEERYVRYTIHPNKAKSYLKSIEELGGKPRVY